MWISLLLNFQITPRSDSFQYWKYTLAECDEQSNNLFESGSWQINQL